MACKDPAIEKLWKEMEKKKEFKKLPSTVKDLIKKDLESLPVGIPIPIIAFKENDWFIAESPLFDLAAQGKSEKEAIDDLKLMIDDYMSDPDTKKPEIEQMVDMHISFTNIKSTCNILERDYGEPRQNSPIASK